MQVCARVSVLKCWVCLAPIGHTPGRPAWCPWPPGSADSVLESRLALLFFHSSWVKALKSSKSNWVLKLSDGRFWKHSPGPTMAPGRGSPETTGSAWEMHCQHSCVNTLPTTPGSSHLPPTPACIAQCRRKRCPTLSRGRTLPRLS